MALTDKAVSENQTEKVADNPRIDSTVAKAFLLYETLASSNSPLGITALSKSLSLQKSNIHRLLNTLVTLGYVQQESDTKRYFPTLKGWQMGSEVAQRNVLRVAARPILMELYRQIGETVYLSIFSDLSIIYLDSITAEQSISIAPDLGVRLPAAITASGNAILAFQKDPAALLKQITMEFPSATYIDVASTLKEFEKIRARGYAISRSGYRRGVNAVAAPVLRRDEIPTVALGSIAMESRFTPARMAKAGELVANAAHRLGELQINGFWKRSALR